MSPLADPPLLEHLLFEKPYPLVVLFVVAAVVLLWAGARGQRRGMMLTAGMMVVAAAAVGVLAGVVETQREKLIAATEQLVERVAEGDIRQLRRTLDRRAFVSYYDGSVWLNYDQIFPKLKEVRKTYAPQRHRVGHIRAEVREGRYGRTDFNVQTVLKTSSRPINTKWRLTWEAHKGDWRVTRIHWLRFEDRRTSSAIAP